MRHAAKLKSFISEPEVTVIVTESKSQRINILGMVARPGTYMLTGAATILDGIAMAGGWAAIGPSATARAARAKRKVRTGERSERARKCAMAERLKLIARIAAQSEDEMWNQIRLG